MSHFTTLSYHDDRKRIEVRVNVDGTAAVTVRNATNDLVEQRSDQIDPRDAHRLITDMFAAASKLPSRPNGDLLVAVGEGAEERSFLVTEYDLPARALETTRIMKMIAADMLAGYDQRSPRRRGGPRSRRMGVMAFFGWALAFGFSFFAANILGTLARLAGALTGPFAFATGNTLALFLMWACYYKVGQMFGETYRGNANVLFPAIAGTLPFLYVLVAYAGGSMAFSIIFAFVMPFIAFKGDQTGY